MKELVSIISNEWLEESELYSNVICLDSPSISILHQINKAPFDALYNLVVLLISCLVVKGLALFKLCLKKEA